MISSVARQLIWPADNNIVVRVVFLYVGQGDSAIVLAECMNSTIWPPDQAIIPPNARYM
jgi:hypothetical protein